LRGLKKRHSGDIQASIHAGGHRDGVYENGIPAACQKNSPIQSQALPIQYCKSLDLWSKKNHDPMEVRGALNGVADELDLNEVTPCRICIFGTLFPPARSPWFWVDAPMTL
jgi:hypothetical protein